MEKTKLEQWICQTESLPELSREALDALQLRRLNETLQRLHDRLGDRCPYPDRLESLEQLQTLPFTTPEMLADHPGQFLLTSQSEISRVISGATSGTSGPAKRVFYTQADTENTVGFFAAGISEMLAPGERCLIGFPFTGSFGLGDLIAKAVESLGGHPIAAGNAWTWGSLMELVNQHQPQTFIGFPATLLGLGRMYGKRFPIQRALVSGDACPPGVMAALETMLGYPLFPHYGSRECGLGGAITCPAHQGMHIRENHIIPEIIDEKGNVLPDGAWGELVITTIGLQAMTLIRYRTGDFTRLLPPCPCGGVTRRMDSASRKDTRMEQLDSALFPLEGLVDYEVLWDGTLTLHIRACAPVEENTIRSAAETIFPNTPIRVQTEAIRCWDAPLYPGKRYLKRIAPRFQL